MDLFNKARIIQQLLRQDTFETRFICRGCGNRMVPMKVLPEYPAEYSPLPTDPGYAWVFWCPLCRIEARTFTFQGGIRFEKEAAKEWAALNGVKIKPIPRPEQMPAEKPDGVSSPDD